MALIQNLKSWLRRPDDYAPVDSLRHVLLADPSAFRIGAAQNPLMTHADGNLRVVNSPLAQQQWSHLHDVFHHSGLECMMLDADPSLPDLCFTANPSFVMPVTSQRREIWCARMRYESRRAEVDLHVGFFHAAGFLIREMPQSVQRFEGHGDGLWHPGRQLLHAAIGPRSEKAAWETLAAAYPELDILLYHLKPGNQYHLDTALAPLNETTALAVTAAFSQEDLSLVQAAFPNLLQLDPAQGALLLGNAFCADGHTVFLASGDPPLVQQLEQLGFRVITLELSEFHKAGGSVFCLKQAY